MTQQVIRTRFAPSPTGFLHIGGARTGLFSWAYARANNGEFILRIEDTDIERSTKESVDSIIHAMDWLGLNYDEGPYFQTKRMERYKEVIKSLVDKKLAYPCYCSKEELDTMREEQMANGQKPKYDKRCLHNPQVKSGVKPVIRFKNPDSGSVIWDDLVKGRIEISNAELDDLIIARSDGTPTYNFCVVVDDWDMQISHVIRGDDHVNNTPRQINILAALGATIPLYAHTPMILREDGHKMSKRTDAVSVIEYRDMGILPEALLNYLARLCWGHGDDEVFSIEQFINWFHLDNISGSPARFDIKKLLWVNAQHIKTHPNDKLATLVNDVWTRTNSELLPYVQNNQHLKLTDIIEFIKPRVDNINDLAYQCSYIYKPLPVNDEDKQKHLTNVALLAKFGDGLKLLPEWTLEAIKIYIKQFCQTENIKMPELGMPLRLKLCGTTQTPSFDNIVYLLGINEVIHRLNS
jgi:glutamyl-tRNA synthetase